MIYIGCAGWSIASAHADRFARDGSHLERYAQVFNAVEINSSFYRQHQPRTYARWAQSVPARFRFSVKMPRSISHEKRLQDCTADLQVFLDQVDCLGDKLGAVLLQLPPSFVFDARIVLPFLDALRKRHAARIAVEPRHASWLHARVGATLRERGIARVAADPAMAPRAAVPAGTRQFQYWRLHGSPHMYRDPYSAAVLAMLARRLARASPTCGERWCIFDNTAAGHAIANAMALQSLLGAAD